MACSRVNYFTFTRRVVLDLCITFLIRSVDEEHVSVSQFGLQNVLRSICINVKRHCSEAVLGVHAELSQSDEVRLALS